jgi:hypothetical protein
MDVIQLPTSTSTENIPAATCAGCGAPLAADQRYCLACGRPCSPVRLAFLDVLQTEPQTATVPILGAPQAAGYAPPPDPPGLVGSLRRWSGVFGLLGVLLAALLIGLLVGHWLTGGSTNPGKQVFEVKGLGALAAAPAGGSSNGSTGGSSGSGSSSSANHNGAAGSGSSQTHSGSAGKSESGEAGESAAEEKQAVKEAQKAKPLPAAHKTSSSALKKLEHTTGKQHAKEVKAALGDEPIETH